ncbi:MAG: hypothetical protein J6D06_10260 [Clostridia bacterium]|nr:hypothetical protein [Clostridia bacterium]
MKASLKQNFITKENLNDNLFYNALAEELNKIIEEELNKNYEDINAELIDDCCLALSDIYELQNGDGAESNIININSVIKKYNLQKRKKFAVAAACAAVATFAVGTTIFAVGNRTIIAESELVRAAKEKFEEIFAGKEPHTERTTEATETTAVTETTEAQTATETQQQAVTQTVTQAPITTHVELIIKNITAYPPLGFYATFSSRDEISLNNFYVRVNYTNGEYVVVPISDASYEICETEQDGTTEIKISYEGFTTSYYVTVLPEEKQNPVTITSIYGTFANEYTIDDMSVIAVFSDGTEKQIPKSECTITTEPYSDEEETGVIVNVEYQGCSFQFFSEQVE